jgi:hypothetical protein
MLPFNRYRAEEQPVFCSQTTSEHKRAKGANVCTIALAALFGLYNGLFREYIAEAEILGRSGRGRRHGSACPLGVLHSIPILCSVPRTLRRRPFPLRQGCPLFLWRKAFVLRPPRDVTDGKAPGRFIVPALSAMDDEEEGGKGDSSTAFLRP